MAENIIFENKRIDHIEERVVRTEDKIAQLDKSMAVYSAIFERNLQIQEKFSISVDKLDETIRSIQQTLITIISDNKRNYELQQVNSNKIGEIEQETEKKITEMENKLRGKMDKLDEKIDDVDDKGKFDFLKFAKENLFSITVAAYMIYDVVTKFLQK